LGVPESERPAPSSETLLILVVCSEALLVTIWVANRPLATL
jgi:hypothetical protein